ncbi:hypothetical protein Trydic_g11890 [Trypoxylus dichotomus]
MLISYQYLRKHSFFRLPPLIASVKVVGRSGRFPSSGHPERSPAYKNKLSSLAGRSATNDEERRRKTTERGGGEMNLIRHPITLDIAYISTRSFYMWNRRCGVG